LDWFKANKGKSSTRLAINSNLGAEVDVDRLLDSVDGLDVDIYTSNESTDAQAEYIRDGLDYKQWLFNMGRLAASKKIRAVHVMCTINALCLDSLPDFIDELHRFKQIYGKKSISFTLNILRFPSFQSPLVLPNELRTQCRDRLIATLTKYKDSSLFHEHEHNHLQRLIDYLDVVKTPHSEAFELPKLRSDFKQFHQQYDQRRGTNFNETFPELADFYENAKHFTKRYMEKGPF
jgi:hypothetical protein